MSFSFGEPGEKLCQLIKQFHQLSEKLRQLDKKLHKLCVEVGKEKSRHFGARFGVLASPLARPATTTEDEKEFSWHKR